jgi:hypothetical protein
MFNRFACVSAIFACTFSKKHAPVDAVPVSPPLDENRIAQLMATTLFII